MVQKTNARCTVRRTKVGSNSSVSETYGQQQGTAYNGHFECLCYRPLFLFNQFGDLETHMGNPGKYLVEVVRRSVLSERILRMQILANCRDPASHFYPPFSRPKSIPPKSSSHPTPRRSPDEMRTIHCVRI